MAGAFASTGCCRRTRSVRPTARPTSATATRRRCASFRCACWATSAAQLETDVENASALVHKNLVEVLTVGREADFFYIATELLDGQTLREFIDGKRREGRTVSFRGACNLMTHIANGLERAASCMPHGGLNPATVWVNKAGRVKVADLGLARTLPTLARRGMPSGAPEHAYLAPELLAGGPPTLASDVYSLGVILFEVLTGRLPSPPLRIAGNGTDAPAGIDAFIAKALARDPGARFQSPMELRQALSNLQAGVSSGVSAVGPAPAAPARAARAPGGSSGQGGKTSGTRPRSRRNGSRRRKRSRRTRRPRRKQGLTRRRRRPRRMRSPRRKRSRRSRHRTPARRLTADEARSAARSTSRRWRAAPSTTRRSGG